MDYAFCPGDSAGPRLLREALSLRPNTTMPNSGERTLKEFMEWLRGQEAISGVAGSIFLGAHGTDSGKIMMDMGDDHVHDPSDPGVMTFKFLSEIDRTQIDHRVLLTTLTRPTSLASAATKLHFKGCNIGQAAPYLRLFKRLLGDKITVTAPLHFYEMRDNGSLRGLIEFLCYEFEARTPALDGTRKASAWDTSRKIVEQGFIPAQHKDIHGVLVPDTVWRAMVADDMRQTGWRDHQITIKFGRPMPFWNGPGSAAPERTITEDTYRSPDMRRHDLDSITLDVAHTGPAPSTQAAGRQLLKLRWPTDLNVGLHPTFPPHQRKGYANLDAFIDGYFWIFRTRTDGRMTCEGWRHRYRLLVPVTDAAGTLIFNFTPRTTNPNQPIRLLDENNPKLFLKV